MRRFEEQGLFTPRIVDERDLDLTRPRPLPNPPVWQAIADDLRCRLLNGAWAYGDHIASERQLAEDYGVARPTIREAIRALTGEGLLEMQRSNAGGAVVKSPYRWSEETYEELRRMLPRLLYILDHRAADESYAARLAASKRAQKHLDALQDAVQAMEDASKKIQDLEKQIADGNLSLSAKEAIRKGIARVKLEEYRRGDAMFHLGVAVAAGNPFLLETIQRIRTQFFTAIAVELLARSEERRSVVIEHHEKILEYIADGDEDNAAKAMREHIESTKKVLSKLLENDLERRIAVNEEETPDADEVRDLLGETNVFVLRQDGAVNAELFAEEHDILHFVSDGPKGAKQIMVPVFTRPDFVQDAFDQIRDWQTLPVLELRGSELLSELEPQLTVAINPCSPPTKFELPVAGVQTVGHRATA